MKVSERISQKSDLVTDLSNQIKSFESFLVFEYLSLTAVEIEALRKELRESKSKLIVQKNNIINRSLKMSKLVENANFKGPNALLLSGKDISPIQKICSLKKKNSHIKLKAAFFDNVLLENERLEVLSSLKSKDELLVSFSQTVLSPLYQLLFLLKQIPKQN